MSAPISLVGGVVAHNDASTIGAAIRSLLAQDLGGTAEWSTIWVVASGCTDATVEIVASLADREPRMRPIVERERRGKASALNAILAHAHGDALVLLNGDAYAEPGSVSALLDEAADRPAPFAVMARPVPPHEGVGRVVPAVASLLWTFHANLHEAILRDGRGNHLSDELLLVSLPPPVIFPRDTINDGAFLGAKLCLQGGARAYAPAARVRIQIPDTVGGYLDQRRRIYVGHWKVAEATRVVPNTMVTEALRRPRGALRVVRRTFRENPNRGRLPVLLAWESIAVLMASWDRWGRPRDHVRWRRIAPPQRSPAGTERGSART